MTDTKNENRLIDTIQATVGGVYPAQDFQKNIIEGFQQVKLMVVGGDLYVRVPNQQAQLLPASGSSANFQILLERKLAKKKMVWTAKELLSWK